jgi:hypothetical protein
MANTRKRLKGTAVYFTNRVYDCWVDSLTAKELAMAMSPSSIEEMRYIYAGDRKDFCVISVRMPHWWVEWYKSLDMEEKFRFGRLVEKRLKSVGLIGSII